VIHSNTRPTPVSRFCAALFVAFTLATVALSARAPRSQELIDNEQLLVAGSRAAILSTGISVSYFANHFKLVTVVDTPSDRRVVWQFTFRDYSAVITDSVGVSRQGSEQKFIHGITNALGRTFDIKQVLSRPRALSRLRACIGDFAYPSVQYVAVNGTAELVMSAEARRTKVRRRTELNDAKVTDARSESSDQIKSEGAEEKKNVIIGIVNLRTGHCTKGTGIATP